MKAFILSAGFGTRLRPFTNFHPKALAKVHDRSLLEINIRNLQRFGIYDVVVNVHHFADQVMETLKKEKGFGSNYEISDERDEILETGGGLKKAHIFFKEEEDFLMINVDILSNFNLQEMIDQHKSGKAMATLAVQNRKSTRYLIFDKNRQLCGWENTRTGEKKMPAANSKHENNYTQLAFSGIQLLNTSVFNKIKLKGKFSIIDVYLSLCGHERIIAWDHSNDILLDVGKPESLIAAGEIMDWL